MILRSNSLLTDLKTKINTKRSKGEKDNKTEHEMPRQAQLFAND